MQSTAVSSFSTFDLSLSACLKKISAWADKSLEKYESGWIKAKNLIAVDVFFPFW
jgi:hypothetical protein